MAGKKLTPSQMKLAAMSGNKKKITRGDVITAAKKNSPDNVGKSTLKKPAAKNPNMK